MSAAISLLWMRRSLQFLAAIMRGVADDRKKGDPVSKIAKEAYAEHLEPYHGWLLKNTFAAALSAIPSRNEFLSRLAPAVPPANRERVCYAELRECAAIPISKTQSIESDVDGLISCFDSYGTPQWRVDDSYAQVQSLISLISKLTSLLNSTITPEMRSQDIKVARQLSVTTASALATMEPRARALFDSVQNALRVASEFQSSFAGIAEDFEKSAAVITED